jgi:hypothetical protein
MPGPAAAAAACIRAGDRRAPGISFTRTGTAIVSPSGGVFLNDAAPSSSAWKGRDNGALGIDPSRSDRAPADGFYAGDGLGAVFDDSPASRPPTPRAGDRGAESGPDVARHRVRFFPDRGCGPETRRADPETARGVPAGLTGTTVAT